MKDNITHKMVAPTTHILNQILGQFTDQVLSHVIGRVKISHVIRDMVYFEIKNEK